MKHDIVSESDALMTSAGVRFMMSYQDILEKAQQLSPSEKARLLADLSAALQRELRASTQPKRSLLGIWEGVDLSAEEINHARDEMWGNFPREDIG
jgi:hypothetical protein